MATTESSEGTHPVLPAGESRLPADQCLSQAFLPPRRCTGTNTNSSGPCVPIEPVGPPLKDFPSVQERSSVSPGPDRGLDSSSEPQCRYPRREADRLRLLSRYRSPPQAGPAPIARSSKPPFNCSLSSSSAAGSPTSPLSSPGSSCCFVLDHQRRPRANRKAATSRRDRLRTPSRR